MNVFKSSGFAVGIMVDLILVVIFFKFANSNHKIRTEYDERQKELRGRGYMFGFYAIIIYECLMMFLGFCGISVPVEPYFLHFGAILTGCMVLVCHSIWNGSYFGLNNNPGRYAVVFTFVTVLNAVPFIGAVLRGTLMEDGKPGTPFLNLLVILMMLIIGAVMLIRKLTDRETE